MFLQKAQPFFLRDKDDDDEDQASGNADSKNGNDSKDDHRLLKLVFKVALENLESEPESTTSLVSRYAKLLPAHILGYYLSGKASNMKTCPLQREPDIMQFPLNNGPFCIIIGSDGVFPESTFASIGERFTTEMPSASILRRLRNATYSRDDKSLIVVTIRSANAPESDADSEEGDDQDDDEDDEDDEDRLKWYDNLDHIMT